MDTRWIDSIERVQDDSVFIRTPDAADASVFRRAMVHMTKRGGQRRWGSHHREVENEDGRELHDRTAKSVKQLDEQSKRGRNLSRRWGLKAKRGWFDP